jgi:hypothetical protein
MGSDSPSSSYGGTSKSVSDVGDVFDSATDKMQQKIDADYQETRVRNVFISFHNEDERKVDLLRSQSKREQYDLEFNDHSVKSKIDQKWRDEVKQKISRTSATIVMIGEHTASRPNVLFEIEESYRQGKKVIGVMIRSDKNYKIPKPMLDNNAPVVPWKLSRIQDELNKD